MEIVKYAVAAIAAYLLGSVNVGILLTRGILKKDVRQSGSGNAGATNVARVFGMKMGVFTFLGDVLKTVAAMLIGFFLLGETGKAVAGMACLAGHCWPVFFGFKGGKGVTVAASVALMLDWRFFAILVVVFFTTFLFSRTVSVCSIVSAAAYPICIFALGLAAPINIVLGFFVMTLVIFMHRGNIRRILNHTEPKFAAKKKDRV